MVEENSVSNENLAQPPADVKNIVFLGTPDIAVQPLKSLVEAGYNIELVVTKPDIQKSRNKVISSPVKLAALDLGLNVSHDLADVSSLNVDLGVVVAYGKLIPTKMLEDLAFVNIHMSLLPRWRGAAPIERAILEGDPSTGVCIMDIEPSLDTGGIYASAEVPIGNSQTAVSLSSDLSRIGSELLIQVLDDGLGKPIAQIGEPNYAKKISKSELCIDWDASAGLVQRLSRVGKAWTQFNGKRLIISECEVVEIEISKDLPSGKLVDGNVVCGDGSAVKLLQVQPEGKNVMLATDWLNGLSKDLKGSILG